MLASIAITASRAGSCPAACHASRHASIVPHFVAELHAPLENGASKFNNASRVISSMSITVPPLPASSAATSASCATLSLVSILFCCACEVCLTKRVARTKNRVPGVALLLLVGGKIELFWIFTSNSFQLYHVAIGPSTHSLVISFSRSAMLPATQASAS